MVRTHSHVSETRPDFGRILGIAAAIAVHALAFLLLLIPMAAPAPDAAGIDEAKPIWVIPVRLDPTPLPPAPVAPPAPRTPAPQTVPRPTPTPVAPAHAVIDSGNIAIAPSTGESEMVGPPQAETGTDTGGPVSVGQLAYLTATPPPYPRSELIAGHQGTVLLKVLVDIDGKPLDVTIERSSGNRNLDRAAQRHVLKAWKFQPAMRNGHAVQAYGLVPVVFSLQ